MELYIDASGDPGLNARAIAQGVSSSYYCLGVIALRELDPAEILQKARNEYYDRDGKRFSKEIKYVKAKQEARMILVKHLCGKGIHKHVLGFDKSSNFRYAHITPFMMQRNILATLMELLFEKDAITSAKGEKVDVYFDDGTHERYAKMLERQVRRYAQDIRIHKPQKSVNSPGIQLADILAGSYFHYLMSNDKENEPFELIKNQCKIIEINFERES